MIIIKTNPDTCYFYCAITKKKSTTFIDSPKLQLYYINNSGAENIMSNIYIDSRTNMIIAKDNNGTPYIIDDGCRNMMIRSGYMVLDNYDNEKIIDKDIGGNIHDGLISEISDGILSTKRNYNVLYKANNNDFIIETDGYKFTIRLYNNIDIVKQNQERKINSLPFYPFDKNMDNYGTIYIAIYCKKIGNTEIKNTIIADNILKSIVDNIRDISVKYVPLNQKSHSIYFSIGD